MDQELQARIDKLARPEHFVVWITMEDTFHSELSDDEYLRIRDKLQLVKQIAAKLAANMVKGTLKYDTDEWSVDQWLDYATDDAVDTVNYLFLMKDERERELKLHRIQLGEIYPAGDTSDF